MKASRLANSATFWLPRICRTPSAVRSRSSSEYWNRSLRGSDSRICSSDIALWLSGGKPERATTVAALRASMGMSERL